MTGYTVNTGSNDKFREGWDKIFASKPAKKSATPKDTKGATAKAKSKGKSA